MCCNERPRGLDVGLALGDSLTEQKTTRADKMDSKDIRSAGIGFMPTPQINFDLLNDDARWADPYECIDLLVAGIWFFYDTMFARHRKSSLLRRLRRLGDRVNTMRTRTGDDPGQLTQDEMAQVLSEMNTLGTIGHSLWHLRDQLGSAGMRFELRELSKVGCGENEAADSLRLLGQGFLLLAAANLAKHGFEIEFISRRRDQSTPDFFAYRDGVRFSCEATTRRPSSADMSTSDSFWSTLGTTIERKRRQFAGPEFANGVLLVDCTPVWDALNLSELAVGGELVYLIPENLGGPRSGSAPLLRYDKSSAAAKLRNLEVSLQGTGIETLILWKNRLTISGNEYKRQLQYRVLGTVSGAVFWSHFEKALVFPGPNVVVDWGPDN